MESELARYAALPAKRMGAGAVICDELGRVLIVEPTYKSTWEIPGGVVEAGESPRVACERELHEELGIVPALGGLVCVDYVPNSQVKTEGIMFLFRTAVISSTTPLTLPEEELRSAEFVFLDRARERLSPGLARRLGCALDVFDTSLCVYLEDGYRLRSA
jgi:ADP-ribose pyrophosphatase YjhB (NUDIX family)